MPDVSRSPLRAWTRRAPRAHGQEGKEVGGLGDLLVHAALENEQRNGHRPPGPCPSPRECRPKNRAEDKCKRTYVSAGVPRGPRAENGADGRGRAERSKRKKSATGPQRPVKGQTRRRPRGRGFCRGGGRREIRPASRPAPWARARKNRISPARRRE